MIKNLLVPIDDSAASTAALKSAIELAEYANATITLMSVVKSSATWVAGPFGAVAELVEEDSRVEHREHERVLGLAADMIPDGIAFRTMSTDGDPAREILRRLEGHEYDLVVLGSRGLGSLKSALMGGVSRRVIERTEKPVLVIRASADDRPLSEAAETSAAVSSQRPVGPRSA